MKKSPTNLVLKKRARKGATRRERRTVSFLGSTIRHCTDSRRTGQKNAAKNDYDSVQREDKIEVTFQASSCLSERRRPMVVVDDCPDICQVSHALDGGGIVN